jgi:hypothetical protein
MYPEEQSTITLTQLVGGVNQTAGSLTAANLLLTGVGAFNLNQSGNDVTTLAAKPERVDKLRGCECATIGSVGGG